MLFAIDSRIIKETRCQGTTFCYSYRACLFWRRSPHRSLYAWNLTASDACDTSRESLPADLERHNEGQCSLGKHPIAFLLFFMWSHQSPPATIQPQNGSWNLKRQEALFIKVYASFSQSLHLLLHRAASWMLYFLSHMDWFWVMHKSMHCTIVTIMRHLHIITWTVLQKHL